MPKYKVLKTHIEWEYAIVEAKTKEDAWAIANDEMDELDWHECKEGNADEEIVSVEVMK